MLNMKNVEVENSQLTISSMGKRPSRQKGTTVAWVRQFYTMNEITKRFTCLVDKCATTYAASTSSSTMSLHLNSVHRLFKTTTVP